MEKYANFGNFAKAIVRQNGEKWPIFGVKLKVEKRLQKGLGRLSKMDLWTVEVP